jgi:hypothetical protein
VQCVDALAIRSPCGSAAGALPVKELHAGVVERPAIDPENDECLLEQARAALLRAAIAADAPAHKYGDPWREQRYWGD